VDRSVLHLDLSDFPVAVERIRDPSLRGRPLLIARPHPRSRVLWASSEARSWGVSRDMALGPAQRLCRGAAVRPPDERLYARAQDAVTRVLSGYSPAVEPDRWGRLFADLSGTGRLFGPVRDTAQRIGREIAARVRLASRLGLSTNKSTSEVASHVGDDGLVDVFPGSEAAFLSPLDARLLPGADQARADLLEELNIRRIRQFAQIPPARLALVFGRLGPLLHLRALGRDPRLVRPPEKKPSVWEEESLAEDSNCTDELLAALFVLAERCAFGLRQSGRAAGLVELTAAYSDNLSVSGKARIAPPSDADRVLFEAARRIFGRVVRRRVRVGYLKLVFSDLVPLRVQLPLFPGQDGAWRDAAIVRAMDRIRARHGAGAVGRGRWTPRVSPT